MLPEGEGGSSQAQGVALAQVASGSPLAGAGLKAGDRIIRVNGQSVTDALDVAMAIARERFVLTMVTAAGRVRRVSIRRRPGQDWGGRLAPLAVRHCGNRCRFCFVDQMPAGLRRSLYVKDEDYRLSFLHGHYVTLTNLAPRDLARIQRLRLSPLYVSVHATIERIRRALLGRKRLPPILPLLRGLAQGKIRFHVQIVVCPGYNDGPVLEQTLSDLARLRPAVLSVALVPVGLTRHRRGLAPLRPVSRQLARSVLRRLVVWQRRGLRQWGTRWVYATDEWYLRARMALPAAPEYEDYPQRENGVGLTRYFLDGLRAVQRRLPPRVFPPRAVIVPVGRLAARMVRRALWPMARVAGVRMNVVAVTNRLFGPSIGVSGLLCGRDIIRALKKHVHGGERMLIAADMIREGHRAFLDDTKVRDLERDLGVKAYIIRAPRDLVRAVVS